MFQTFKKFFHRNLCIFLNNGIKPLHQYYTPYTVSYQEPVVSNQLLIFIVF